MDNEMKAKRLEEMAETHEFLAQYQSAPRGRQELAADAALLLEAAALMRERDSDDALWELEYQRRYKRFDLCAWQGSNGKWHWTATRSDLCYRSGEADTVAAAQGSAVAWVDQQEGK
jgi:uncharacterized cupin superfamily protein